MRSESSFFWKHLFWVVEFSRVKVTGTVTVHPGELEPSSGTIPSDTNRTGTVQYGMVFVGMDPITTSASRNTRFRLPFKSAVFGLLWLAGNDLVYDYITIV